MKVLHITSSLDPAGGGVPVGLAELAASQAVVGLDVELVGTWVTMPATATVERLRSVGVKVTTYKVREPRSWHPRMAALLRPHVQANEIVHVHGMWEQIQFWAARVARKMGRPYIISPHGMIAPWSLGKSNWSKRLYVRLFLKGNLDHAAAVHYTTTIEREQTGVAPIKGKTIIEPTGVNLDEFRDLPSPGQFRSAHPELGDRKFIVSLGRLALQKGFDLLIPAFAQAKLGDAALVLVGPDEGGYKNVLETLAKQHGVADRVFFPGMTRGSQRIAALVDAQLFALSSYQENFGLVVVEAMAAGAPVLISDRVNIYPEVAGAEAGPVVPCEIGKIAAELRRWMNDAAMCRAAGERGRHFAFEQYDSLRIARRWAEHYERLNKAADGIGGIRG